MQSLLTVPTKTWLLLWSGPLLFFVAIVGSSVVLSSRGVAAAQIAARVPLLMPQILLGVLVCLAVFIIFQVRVAAVWTLPPVTKAVGDMAIGVLVGSVLAVAYIFWIAPGLEGLQRTVGDYVPAGSVLPTVSGSIGVFFIANVILAPWVEETLYRGYAIPLLATHVGVAGAVAITCILFGLLHWPGGIWYMLLTGAVVGGAFAGLFVWRAGVLAPFVAHITLNLIEFIYAYRLQHVT